MGSHGWPPCIVQEYTCGVYQLDLPSVAMQHRRNHDKIDQNRSILSWAQLAGVVLGTCRLSPSNIVLAPLNNLNRLQNSMNQERFSNVPMIVKYSRNQLKTEDIINEFATEYAKNYFNIDRRQVPIVTYYSFFM